MGFHMSVKIPWEQLSETALRGLVEEYVTREGTDYGHQETSLERKVEQVMAQLRDGTAIVSYDSKTGSVTIISACAWHK